MRFLWKDLLFWSLPIFIILFSYWPKLYTNRINTNNMNSISSKITYGKFLTYIDKNWIKKIDLYENGQTAIIEIIKPILGNRIKVELPVSTPELIDKIKKKQIDLEAHSIKNYTLISNSAINFLFFLLLTIGLILLSKRIKKKYKKTISYEQSKKNFQIKTQVKIILNDIAGIDEAKEEFQELITFLKNKEHFTAVGATIPKGILLIGPPGTGKTLLTKAVAREANVPFFSISGSEFTEMFIGVGASRVRDLFIKAKKNTPCIIFIDEIDAVGRQRATGIKGSNDEREQTLNQLLTEMDGFENNNGIIIIAATNRIDILDSALLRPGRFDRQINLNMPNVKDRLNILNLHIKNKKINPNISLLNIAQKTPGFSGADLANLLNEAAILTARKHKPQITLIELDKTIDKIQTGLEGQILINNRSKRLIAYHEIGHAIIATILKDHNNVDKVTLIPHGQIKGWTSFISSEKDSLISRSQIKAKIIRTLGGKATEEVVFGNSEVTNGASNDLKQVTLMTKQMVTKFGMSNIGIFSLEKNDRTLSLKKTIQYSDKTEINIDQQVKLILDECHKSAIQIIKNNRVIIDKLVDILIDKETMHGKELTAIINQYTKLF
uniref:ATP-dependent zinc metalloprotease FtsH n=1 Tax=Harveyella mirabilis TaxID=282355 RepID=A0A3S8UVW2_9FLOR|nr:cell division protein FTSH [Harveyella mirabilis]